MFDREDIGQVRIIVALLFPLSVFATSKPPVIPPRKNVVFAIDANRYMPRATANGVIQNVVGTMPIRFPYRVRVMPRNGCKAKDSSRTERSLQLRCFSSARKNIRGRVLILTEPLIEQDILYTAGMAYTGCNPNSTALCNVTRTNQAGVNREEFARVACSHELAHLFGARHDNAENPPSIMHENALHFADSQVLGFSQRSRAQIFSCKQ